MKRKLNDLLTVNLPIIIATSLLLELSPVTLFSFANANENNVYLHGALVSEPCVILPGDEDIQLNFGTIIDKYIYTHTRTLGQKFNIRLSECDLHLGQTLKISFQGQESTALPGLLAINAEGGAKGIAIGLENADGKPLPLNTESNAYSLESGSTLITLKAYAQGEPDAIANHTIGLGTFGTTATFKLEYE
ncbi:fimbrial protein [Serratia marcescens]|uniref:fimbrial protein n=1 Tax=Serratia TaxID=613 RepID=UPI000C1304CF|nr:fimbrial protein [Serratia marcescens]PHY73475.1 exotoxin [Serratia marcescens]PIC08956.1 exotoxin [Serratia marcescens]CAI2146081.1 Fimbria A protein precursor [Serratia marcescens]HAT2878027.1 type 1 fimbrial protein [Serratia marcescens]HAT2889350.1 type 1 fimbrial protein [Serratia marcescens]